MGSQESGGSLHLDHLGIGRRSCGRQHPSQWGSSGEARPPQPSIIEPDCLQRFAKRMATSFSRDRQTVQHTLETLERFNQTHVSARSAHRKRREPVFRDASDQGVEATRDGKLPSVLSLALRVSTTGGEPERLAFLALYHLRREKEWIRQPPRRPPFFGQRSAMLSCGGGGLV